MAEPPIIPQCPKRRGLHLGDGPALDGQLRTGSGGPGLLEREGVTPRDDRRIAIDFARDAAVRLISLRAQSRASDESHLRIFDWRFSCGERYKICRKRRMDLPSQLE